MLVVLANAYSRKNSGDGLLVDESARLAREAWPDADIAVLAMEPDTFPDYAAVRSPMAGHGLRPSRMDVLRTVLTRRPTREARQLLAEASVVLSVGGGYLRAPTVTAGLKSVLAHATQLPTKRGGPVHICLPQSVGPLPPGWHRSPFGRLQNAAEVHVRDDRSLIELKRLKNVVRTPDMAVLAIGERRRQSTPSHESTRGAGTAIIARSLARGRAAAHYEERVRVVAKALNARFLLQSDAGSGNNDTSFYRGLGLTTTPVRAGDVMGREDGPALVVSVRLHGALEAILAGVPSIHLSYERKGWGAFEDLGIAEFVHNAHSFDPDLVIDQARSLLTDPTDYWRRIDSRASVIAIARQRLIDDLRRYARSPG